MVRETFNVLVTICLLGACGGYNILCLLPYPGKSHNMVFEPLLAELTARGHNLTVVSFFTASNKSENRRDVSLKHLAPVNVEVVDLEKIYYSLYGFEKYFEHVPLVTTLAKINLALCDKILNSQVFNEFLRTEGNYDLILVEHFNSDCMLGIVHNYGVPSVGLISSTMMPWTLSRVGAPDNPSYVPGMTLYLTDDMSLAERIENTFYLYFYKMWYRWFIRNEEQKLLERKLGKRIPILEEIAKNTSLVLVNTHHSFNGVRVMPPAIVEVGGIHLHKKLLKPLPQDIEDWVSGAKDGVIVFSFGSLIRGSSLPPRHIEIFMKVFSRMRQRVLWKWEDNGSQEPPPNVMKVTWLPQYDLLNHEKCVAFITHGGLLSLTEAVDAGVPMLMIPILGDQFGNAAHAVQAGVASSLRLQDLNEDFLFEALKRVLSTKMRNRAKELREEWRDRPESPMASAVYWIERVARHNSSILSSPSRHMPYYKTMLLDVIAITAVIVVLITLIVVYLLKKIIVCRIIKLKQS